MPAKAVGKYMRVPPRKAREVVELIEGLPVDRAEQVVKFCRRRAAKFVGKVLKSAVANAEQTKEGQAGTLYVAKVVVNEGPMLKRIVSRARGVRNLIRRRTSHVTIIVEER